MRIAIVTHNVLTGDGQGRVNHELVCYLLANGHRVELFADRVADDLVDAGAHWTRIHPGFQGIDLLKVWRFRRLADRALRNRVDDFDAIIACGVVLGLPHHLNVAHFVHGTWLNSPFHASKVRGGIDAAYQMVFSRLNAIWEKQVFAQARSVGAVSQMVSDELIEIGVKPDKIHVLGNGVDTKEFAPRMPGGAGYATREVFGLPDAVPLALFVGDIQSSIKNLDAVLAALVQVPGLHLAVAGRIGTSPYPAMAEGLGVQDRVHFLDFRSDIADLMRAADFFVLVSRRDSCPLVLIEAVSSGLPVVTARTVGNSDLVRDKCGFVIDSPDDIDGLTRALDVLANNPEERERLSVAARNVGLENTWDRMSQKYVEVLDLQKSGN